MKKGWSIVTILLFSICLSGCESLSRQTEYGLDDNHIQFTLPKVWQEIEIEDVDLALTKPSADLIMNIYHQSDLDGLSAQELLEEKIKSKMKEMNSSSLLKEYKANEINNRVIYSKLYTANKDGVEKQYYFGVMEFTGTHTYIYLLYEAAEMYMKYNIDDVQRILIRMKWTGEEDLALR